MNLLTTVHELCLGNDCRESSRRNEDFSILPKIWDDDLLMVHHGVCRSMLCSSRNASRHLDFIKDGRNSS